jgi:Mg2+-importing ATPase
VLLLVFAAIASTISGEWVDAEIVGAILAASIAVGYFREYRAESAISRLLDRVQITAQVVRDGSQRAVPVREVVPGDVIALAAGSIVPADAVLISATDLHVDDAVLTGESFPVLKRVGPSAEPCGLRDRAGCVQFGTNVQSGTARALVVGTGKDTAFGAIAMRAAPLWRAFACGDARHDCGGVCGKCAPRGSLSRCASLLHSSFALDAGAGAVDQEGCWCGPPQRLRSLR